ncbi:processed variable antigen-like [Palaemon carinicauda]|uniref:processed variable antigen-like n=1 Tax=Palaemon carinicauda TaxID=392227 RepID=UPI0035B63DC6
MEREEDDEVCSNETEEKVGLETEVSDESLVEAAGYKNISPEDEIPKREEEKETDELEPSEEIVRENSTERELVQMKSEKEEFYNNETEDGGEKDWMPMSTLEEEEQADDEDGEKSLDLMCGRDNLSEETNLGDEVEKCEGVSVVQVLEKENTKLQEVSDVPTGSKDSEVLAEREETFVVPGSENSEVLAEREETNVPTESKERGNIQQPVREDSQKTNKYSEHEFGNGDPEEEEYPEDEYCDEDYYEQ